MILFASAHLVVPPPASSCPLADPTQPRLLVIALDGVSLRHIEEARDAGAFADWPEPVALISTFPSMSNVAFTAMLERFGAERIAGYETRHYDVRAADLVGGSTLTGYGWKGMFDIKTNSLGGKTALYLEPADYSRRVLEQVREAVLDSADQPLVMVHLAATDMVSHLRGDRPTFQVVMDSAALLERLRVEHRESFGRELDIVLLSDHGNGIDKVTYTDGLRDVLRAGGFRFTRRLNGPRDIVAPTYGAVSYGALYLDPSRAEEAARLAVTHESVDLAAWISGEHRVSVVAESGEARILWRESPRGRSFSYTPVHGDPLRLSAPVARLEARGLLDSRGFAEAAAWFQQTVGGAYPDAPGRLVDSLSDRWVENPATVMLSLHPDYAWGKGSVRFGARITGGRIEGTHGALDRESSLGFLLTSDPRRQPAAAIPAELAFAEWTDIEGCLPRPSP